MKQKSTLLTLAALAVVSACASTGVETNEPAPIEAIEERISEAMETSANANRAIAEVEVATAAPVRAGPSASIPNNVVLPPAAVQPITVDWNGPVETFLQAISERSGYTLTVTGRAPANQMIVSIRANDEPLFGVVRRTGNMIHGYGDIVFNPSNRTIELRYGG